VIYHDRIGSTLAGLVLLYSSMFTQNITFMLRAHANVQMNLNSAERIMEYTQVEIEKYNPEPQTDSDDQSDSPANPIHPSAVASNIRRHVTSHLRVYSNPYPSRRLARSDSTASDYPLNEDPDLENQNAPHSNGLKVLNGNSDAYNDSNEEWVEEGSIEFRLLSMRYRANGPDVLKYVHYKPISS
jgi:ABC-type multidrug transport system fused ATPase/permease subunit